MTRLITDLFKVWQDAHDKALNTPDTSRAAELSWAIFEPLNSCNENAIPLYYIADAFQIKCTNISVLYKIFHSLEAYCPTLKTILDTETKLLMTKATNHYANILATEDNPAQRNGTSIVEWKDRYIATILHCIVQKDKAYRLATDLGLTHSIAAIGLPLSYIPECAATLKAASVSECKSEISENTSPRQNETLKAYSDRLRKEELDIGQRMRLLKAWPKQRVTNWKAAQLALGKNEPTDEFERDKLNSKYTYHTQK